MKIFNVLKNHWKLTLAILFICIWIVWLVLTIGAAGKKSEKIIEPPKPSESLYTVKPGDTLDDIANRFGTTWEKLWEANKDLVKDPNLIYPGQKLKLKNVVLPKIALSPNEFNKRLYTLMFRQIGMDPAPEHVFNVVLTSMMRSMEGDLSNKNFYKVRQNLNHLRTVLIGLETHRLSKAITSLYEKDKDMAYLVTALVWKETGFHNRRGKAGELGYYQFLSSTVDDIYGKGENGRIAKRRIEEDTEFATEFAVWYLNHLKRTYKTWDQALYHYNGHPDYSRQVMHKLKKTKEIM